VCKEKCPKCGKDGIKSDEYRKYIENWREADKKRKEEFHEQRKS
jgi:hypothetical protein